MPTLQNPLRRPKPARADVVFRGTYQIADEHARYRSSTQVFTVRLTEEELWLCRELSIPLRYIRSVDVIRAGRVPPRRALRVVYHNPIAGVDEAVYLCSVLVLVYRTGPLEKLRERIEAERALLSERGLDADDVVAAEDGEEVELQCEVCGSTPACYVGYRHLVGALLLSYLSEERRRTHCRWHNFLAGTWSYLVTVTVGWIGWSILAWPVVVYRCALNLRPSLGRFVHVLGVAPILLLGAVIWIALTGS